MTENKHFVPWTSSDSKAAADEAKIIVKNSKMSVNVVDIDHPTEIDDEQIVTFSEETFELMMQEQEKTQ
jgi:hypothetical protein